MEGRRDGGTMGGWQSGGMMGGWWDSGTQQAADDSTLATVDATLETRGRKREREWCCWLSVQDVALRKKRGVGRKHLYI